MTQPEMTSDQPVAEITQQEFLTGELETAQSIIASG